MKFDAADIEELGRREKANLINSLTGFRQPFIIGTISSKGIPNAAVINSLTHLGSSPPLMGIIFRPVDGFQRDSYTNLKESGQFTCSIVTAGMYKRAHATSAKFDQGISEFKECRIPEYYVPGWLAPFAGESPLKMGLIYREEHVLSINKTVLVIGELEYLEVEKDSVNEVFDVDVSKLGAIPISGLYNYYSTPKMVERLPYAKPEDSDKIIADEKARPSNKKL